MIPRTFTRAASPPHVPTLADAIRAMIVGTFHILPRPGAVVIEAADWTGVNLAAVQAQVDAAEADTELVRARYEADALPPLLKAALLTLLDAINVERARHGAAAITPAQFVTQVKAKVS